jgi:hypothetical protein
MKLSEVRKQFREVGFSLRVQTFSFGKHASIYNKQGQKMPSIFFDPEHLEQWMDAVQVKSQLDAVTDDSTNETIYGFST